jgi:hypothetical protein
MVAVDLHRQLSSNCPRLDIDEVWAAARPGGGDGRRHLLPRAEDMFVHVALHFSRERTRKSDGALGQLADLAWLSAAAQIDWGVLVDRARRWGVQGRVFLALFCATDLLGPIGPAEVLEELRPATVSIDLASQTLRRRVLGTKPWLPPDYFTPHRRAANSPKHRLFPTYDELVERSRTLDTDEHYARLYLRRASSVVSSMTRPWTVPTDMRLGRWLESLDASGDEEPRFRDTPRRRRHR